MHKGKLSEGLAVCLGWRAQDEPDALLSWGICLPPMLMLLCLQLNKIPLEVPDFLQFPFHTYLFQIDVHIVSLLYIDYIIPIMFTALVLLMIGN